MGNLSDTIARLKSARGSTYAGGLATPTRLSPLAKFGANPGALRAHTYMPEGLPKQAPLVVVLHGCTQTAASYDHGAGWSQLADRQGFALLYPEQQRANNPNLCFNWFVPKDIERDSGEAFSITRPAAGLYHRAFGRRRDDVGDARNLSRAFRGRRDHCGAAFWMRKVGPEAFDRLRGHALASERDLEAKVRGASRHQGPWPTLSLWHGTADQTVAHTNMDAIVAQWRSLHGLQQVSPERDPFGPHSRRVWRDEAGVQKIEAFSVAGMGHGTPLDGRDDIGAQGAFMLDAGISSTRHIAQFWQLTESGAELSLTTNVEKPTSETTLERVGGQRSASLSQVRASAAGVGKVIEDALRAAGLMR